MDNSAARKRVATDLKSLVHSVPDNDDVEFHVKLLADAKVLKLFKITPPEVKPATGTSSPPTPFLTTAPTTTVYPSLPVLPKFAPKTDFAIQTSIVGIRNLHIPPIPDNSTEELEE